MDVIETCYMSVAKAFLPIGRLAFLPYSYIQTTLQALRYLIMNTLSYIRLLCVYNHNLLHIMKETDHEKETFDNTFKQIKFNNKHRIRNKSLPVSVDIRDNFDPPTNLSEYFFRLWFRTDYYYDRYIVNYPIDLINGSIRSYVYDPNESVKYVNSSKYSGVVPDVDNNSEGKADINFVPKPYVITESIKKKNDSQIPKPDISACPVFSGLLFEPPVSSPQKSDSVVKNVVSVKENDSNSKNELTGKNTWVVEDDLRDEKALTVENALTIEKNFAVDNDMKFETESRSDHSRKFLYKIKIRRKHSKGDNHKDHPTYGRYDLVAQAIKNMLPQPNYLPDRNIGPNMIRFTWHCCAHFDQETGTGGSSGGTMRFAQEFNNPGNTGLTTTKSYLDQIHEQFPWISFADLYTYAGCVAIEAIGGPKIEWKPGRSDCPDAIKVPPIGRLPIATKDYNHIKEVFYKRLGFTAKETVALIGGGHTIGSCHAKFSGFNGAWTRTPFNWDNSFFTVLLKENWRLGIVPETGVEQYFNHDKTLMMLNTDMELLRCPEFKRWVEIYANDSELFNKDFALAFAKLLELGVIRDMDGIQRVKI